MNIIDINTVPTSNISPIRVIPSQSTTDKKVARVADKNPRYNSPPPNLTNRPSKDLNKPSPADSVDSIRSNSSIDSNGSLYERFKSLLAHERPSRVNVPTLGEKRPAQFSDDLEEDPLKRKKVTARRKPTCELPSYGSKEPPLSSILTRSDGDKSDGRDDPMSDQAPKRLR